MTNRQVWSLALGLLGVTPAGVASQENFGSSAAVLGNQVAVGQPANFYGPGAVYLFGVDDDGSWQEVGRLFSPDSAMADGFGRSISGTPERVLVGAPRDGGAGTAYLFQAPASPAGDWTLLARLPTVEGGGSEGFGSAVALGGEAAIVGAPDAKEGGAVYVFDLSGGGSTQVLEPNGMDGAGFGTALSVEEGVLVVGAPAANGQAGAAIVYRRGDDGAWAREAVLSPEGEAAGFFGAAVHISDGRAFVGAPRGSRGIGAIGVYEQAGDGWTFQGR
ncbi:MAG: hypothetical protein HKO53_05650, partial [Gemmatimonadetes bacterium]|nr:hypothetical protein [Gemmatimonadota bacterium]